MKMFMFRSTDEIRKANPDLQAFETYDDLVGAIFSAIK